MHFISTKQDLVQAVNIVNRAVSTKSPMAILAGIHFEVKDDCLYISATDLEMGIRYVTPVGAIDTGAVVLPAKYIAELIRHLPDGPVTMIEDRENGSVIVQYGGSETIINCYPEAEFPEIEFPPQEGVVRLPETALRDTMRRILFAVASEDRSSALNGALFIVHEESIELVATDLHRMAWCQTPTGKNKKHDQKVLIPGKALGELSKIIGKSDSMIGISLTESNIVFTTDNISFITRLLNGKFPDYKKAIPRSEGSKVRVHKQLLLEATERASIFSNVDKSTIKMVVRNGSITITDIAVDGRIHEELEADLEIGMNVYYLNELLRSIDSEMVVIEFYGSVSPCIFRPEGKESYFSLIVPIRV